MIDMFSLWQDFQSLVNTYQSGWYRPQTDFQRAVNDISIELWDKWTSMAEKSQQIKDYLIPFLISKNIIVKPANSYYSTISYPGDYGRFADARIMVAGDKVCCPDNSVENGKCCNGEFKTTEEITEEYYENIQEREIKLIDLQRWASCLSHLTKKPTFENPKMVQIDGGFRVAPKTVSVVVFSFYTKPTEATFNYTVSTGDTATGFGDQIIYDKSNSTPLQWSEITKNEFLWRLGEKFGIFTRDQFMTQISTQQKIMQP